MKSKLKLKLIAAALALAAAGQANAAITLPTTGNGSLFLSVFDSVANKSYVRDLGVLINDFLPNSIAPRAGDNPLQGAMTPEVGVTMGFAGDALFASTFATSLASNLRWNVSGGDKQTGGTFGFDRLLFTTALGQPNTFAFTNGAVSSANFNVETFADITANMNMGCSAAASCVGPYALYQPGANQVTTDGTGFGDLGFYYISRTSTSGFSSAQKLAFANSANLAKWTLASNGNVTYSLAPAVAAVPVPAAAWLLGSGLLGLVGVSRRRKEQDKA